MNAPLIFVVEDDFAVRDSIIMLLRSEGLRARGFAGGEEFLANLPDDPVACVVTDLRMPGVDGVEVVRRVRALHPEGWSIIVITAHADVTSAVELMKSGVADFIEKPFEPSRLLETVRRCVSQMDRIRADLERRADIAHRLAELTARERQVFDALAEGHSNKEIAEHLEISHRTVEIFRAKVMSKMGADSLSALVRMAFSRP